MNVNETIVERTGLDYTKEAPIIELRWRICGDDEILAAENIMENKTINNSSLEGEI